MGKSKILYGINEISNYAGVSYPTLIKWRLDYHFPMKKKGGRWVSHESRIDEWSEELFGK